MMRLPSFHARRWAFVFSLDASRGPSPDASEASDGRQEGGNDVRTCWEIRQAFSERQENGHSDERRMPCRQCSIYAGGAACWTLCSDQSCCCAPLHLSCDFCPLYIEHRREITALVEAVREASQPTAARRRPSLQGGMPGMEKAQFSVPTMWADHHVLKVREALAALPGVQDVIASSAFRAVALSYDPDTIGVEAITAAISDAGYLVAPDGKAEAVSQAVPIVHGQSDPAWSRLGVRISKTDVRDARPGR